MNENFLNLALKDLVAKTRTNISNADLKSQIVAKALEQANSSSQTPIPAPTDTITPQSTAKELLITYQLPIEEENLNIANSFLVKGFEPSKEEIENIKKVLQGLPENADKTKVLENSVSTTIQGLDINNEVIKESIVKNLDQEEIEKTLQEIKSEVIKDKSIPANVRVEISNAIDEIQKEITQATAPQNENQQSEAIDAEEIKVPSIPAKAVNEKSITIEEVQKEITQASAPKNENQSPESKELIEVKDNPIPDKVVIEKSNANELIQEEIAKTVTPIDENQPTETIESVEFKDKPIPEKVINEKSNVNELIQKEVAQTVAPKVENQLPKTIESVEVKDKPIAEKVVVENSSAQVATQKEIAQVATTSIESQQLEAKIVEQIKKAAAQTPEAENQKIISIATKGLEKVESIIEEGVSDQLQKDKLLQETNELYEKIEQLEKKLSSDRKDLIVKIDSTTKDFTTAKEDIRASVQKLTESLVSKNNSTNTTIEDTFKEKIPVFLKSLNDSDEILAKFGAYVSSFPQSIKNGNEQSGNNVGKDLQGAAPLGKESQNGELPFDPNVKNNSDSTNNTKLGLSDILKSLRDNSQEESQDPTIVSPVKSINEKSGSKGLSELTNSPTFKLLYQVANIADSIQSNLQAIKKVINQTAGMPPSASLKDMVKIFQDNQPHFFDTFEKFGFDAIDFPEFKKIQSSFFINKINSKLASEINDGKELIALSGSAKTVNLDLLRNEIERIELEHFKSNESIQGLKKVHDIISKTEAKLVTHQLLDNVTVKPESFHAFELSINPMQENRLTNVEVQQYKKAENTKVKSSFAVNIEVDLSHTGEVKARLFSDENSKQIFMNFANDDFKKLAFDNQDELQAQLKEIPFVSQLFFGSIAKPNLKDNNSAKIDLDTSVHKINSLA